MSVERTSPTLRKLLRSHGYHALPVSQYIPGNADTFWLHSSMRASEAKKRVGEHGELCACPTPAQDTL